MKITHWNHGDFSQNDQVRSSKKSFEEAIVIVSIIAVVTVIVGLVAASIFSVEQMYIIRPLLAAGAVFIIFTYVLRFRVRANLFNEIGFIYLGLALAYTILPAVKFLMMNFEFPLDFDYLNFAVLSPQPAELGIHFWRHALFISGVAAGYLAVRSRPLPLKPLNEKSEFRNGRIIAIIIAIMVGSVFAETLLSSSVGSYIEHYTRFEHLSRPLLLCVSLLMVFRRSCYFVLMALMFSQYRKYRMLIFIVVLIVSAYEVYYSFGSRVVAFTNMLAFLGFYHFRVSPISLKKGIVFLIVLAILFSGIGMIRTLNYSLENAYYEATNKNNIRSSEFEAVYCTGFHLYIERAQETLPPRQWEMFIYEIISVIPFLDHKTYHPQYWYARNYFPQAVVPQTTMGVIADSAIWGGEFDLFVRSLINGAIFAFLTRWFFRRREKWWALTIYIYCYAMCILTIKGSVFYLMIPLLREVLPTVLLIEVLFRLQKASVSLKSIPTEHFA